jgi:hypothetical protein
MHLLERVNELRRKARRRDGKPAALELAEQEMAGRHVARRDLAEDERRHRNRLQRDRNLEADHAFVEDVAPDQLEGIGLEDRRELARDSLAADVEDVADAERRLRDDVIVCETIAQPQLALAGERVISTSRKTRQREAPITRAAITRCFLALMTP